MQPLTVVTCEIIHWDNFEINHLQNRNKIISAAEIILAMLNMLENIHRPQ